MFRGHQSEISLTRREPEITDYEKETLKARTWLGTIAYKAVVGHLNSSKPVNVKKVTKKLERDEAFEKGAKEMQPFLDSWNKWRSFYFPHIAHEVSIKTPSQLGMAKAALEFINENDMNCDIAIAAMFKSFSKRKRVTNLPNFGAIKSFGLETYERWYDSVVGDIEAKIYEEQSS